MEGLEAEHVHKVYSQIAEHFSDTRFKPWPRIAQFLMEQPPGSLIADVGCGNGKYLGVNPRTYKLGSDICSELVTIAASRGHEVAVCDCLNLPYRSNQFDAAICIAVVHHLSTEERRVAALRELMRIVRPGGEALVYVWAMEQEKKKFDSQDVMVPWHLQPKYRGRPAPPPLPSGAKENKMKKLRKKRKKEDKGGGENIESGSTKPDDVLKAHSDLVEEGFLELSSITLSDEGESVLQLKTERPQGCHRAGQLSGSAFDSDQLMIKQDQTECTLRSTTSQGVHSCHYKATHTGNSDGRDLVTDTGTHGGGVQNTDCTGSTETGTALHSLALVEQGYQTFQRYYHVFRKGELSRLFSRLEGVEVLDEFYDHENWCVLTKKKY